MAKKGGKIAYRIRKACLEGVETGVPILAAMITEAKSDADKMRAWEKLAGVALGTVHAVEVENSEVAKLAIRVIREVFPEASRDQFTEFAKRLTEACSDFADVDDGA